MMTHGTFQQFILCPMGNCEGPMVLSLPCWICPMGMLHWSMGHVTCSTPVPWATANPPWSCLLLCQICPMGTVYWTMGHFSCSNSVPWATVHPPGDMSTVQPLSHGHIAVDHGTFQQSYAMDLCYSTMGVCWLMCAGTMDFAPVP